MDHWGLQKIWDAKDGVDPRLQILAYRIMHLGYRPTDEEYAELITALFRLDAPKEPQP